MTGPRVAVVGLGRMGAPIARRLAAVFPTTGFDLAPQAGSPSDADVVVTVLPGPAEVRRVLIDDGVLAAMRPGSLWLDLSSNDPTVVDELTAKAERHGVDAVAAPMSGGPREAAEGELRFFVAGADATVDRARAILAPLGRPHDPPAGERPGQAHLLKLLANGLWFTQVVAVTEALLLATANGIDPESARALLAASPAGSVFLDRHAPRLLAGDDMTDFALTGVVAQLDAVVRLAREAGTPAEVSALVADLHHQALEEFGPVDGELLAARLLERRSASGTR